MRCGASGGGGEESAGRVVDGGGVGSMDAVLEVGLVAVTPRHQLAGRQRRFRALRVRWVRAWKISGR